VQVWIYSDADNTLWDTNAVYANAQLGLLDDAEKIAATTLGQPDRLAFVRLYDQALASRDHRRLKYPPELLVRALALGLKGSQPDAVAERLVSSGVVPDATESAVADRYRVTLNESPPLLPGVAPGLQRAVTAGARVFVVSEGNDQLVRDRLNRLGISHFVSGVLIAPKTPELFRRLVLRADPHPAIVIGDQADRDIAPAVEAGAIGILVPSRFKPKWISAQAESAASYVASDFLDAVNWALATTDKTSTAGGT
jgi:putative hydrolase of the HAD superfamily